MAWNMEYVSVLGAVFRSLGTEKLRHRAVLYLLKDDRMRMILLPRFILKALCT